MNWHIFPDNDIEEHDTESHLCKCDPKIEYVEGTMIVVHNSFDGRELVEQAYEILDNTHRAN